MLWTLEKPKFSKKCMVPDELEIPYSTYSTQLGKVWKGGGPLISMSFLFHRTMFRKETMWSLIVYGTEYVCM